MSTYLASPEGLQRLQESAKQNASAASSACLWSSISCFAEQSGPTLCGAATLALALNSVLAAGCSEECNCAITDIDVLVEGQRAAVLDKEAVLHEGMTMDTFAALARSRVTSATTMDGAQTVTILRSSQSTAAQDAAKDMLLTSLHTPHARVVVNYDMSTAGQTPWGGHFSPIAAYHSGTDSFLVMDVWIHTQPLWIQWRDLFAATCAVDSSSGLPRGFVFLNLSDLVHGRAVSTDLEMTDKQVEAVLENLTRKDGKSKSIHVECAGQAAKVNYIDEGTSSSPPFVIIHDYLSNAECFRPVIDHLSLHGKRALALDLPGYGRSAHVAPCVTMDQWVSLILNFLQALDISSCVLVGHSSGSMIAQQIAAAHPEIVHQLVLSGGTCIGKMPKRFETLEETVANFEKDGFMAHAMQIVKRSFQNMKPSTYRHAYLAEKALAQTSEAAVVASCQAMLGWGDQGRLNLDQGLVVAPTLILWGDMDHLIEKTLANRLKESIADSMLCILPTTGHQSHLEIPLIVGENMICFANNIPIPQFRCEFFIAPELALCMDNDQYVSKALVASLPPPDQRLQKHYRLTCGLVQNLKSANKRCEKFCEIFRAPSLEEHKLRFYRCIQNLLSETDRQAFVADWDVEEFFLAGQEVKQKRSNLLSELQRDFDRQPFVKNRAYKPETVTIEEFNEAAIRKSMRTKLHDCVLVFDPCFLRRVHICLSSVARPKGAFEVADIEVNDSCDGLLSQLKQSATREKCVKCGSNCYLYCGTCGGTRTNMADTLLPARIDLKVFDVLIVLHWQERITSCTGITAAVMALEGQVTVGYWPKSARDRPHLLKSHPVADTQKQMEKVLREIDCETDFLLFPGPGSIDATQVDWNMNYMTTPVTKAENSEGAASSDLCAPHAQPRKRRLIVIESNWQSGKTVYNDLIAGLQGMYGVEKAAKLRCLSLSNVVGKYWKFQAVGHSAVSTIEAIHHAAIIAKKLMKQSNLAFEEPGHAGDEAGVDERREQQGDEYDALLILFRLQRNRLLKEMRRGDRGLPRAMRVTGSGVGDWAVVLDAHGLILKGQVE